MDGCADSKQVAVAFPDFKFNLSQRQRKNFGWITANGEAFHYVSDINGFYAAMGYTKEHNRAAMMPEEFIWDRYSRDGARFSPHCLQVQVSSYLHEHSCRFGEKYWYLFAKMIGKCRSDKISYVDEHCLRCYQHPRFIAEDCFHRLERSASD